MPRGGGSVVWVGGLAGGLCFALCLALCAMPALRALVAAPRLALPYWAPRLELQLRQAGTMLSSVCGEPGRFSVFHLSSSMTWSTVLAGWLQ